jgi:hypothetical protein
MQDYVDEAWEVLRLRRLKASLIAAIAHRGLRETLLPLVGDTQAEALAAAWAVRKSDASTEIERALASAGLTMEAVVAQTLSLTLDAIARIDHMVGIAQARRNAAVCEIEHHRAVPAFRRAVKQVEDAKLRVIESTPRGGADA